MLIVKEVESKKETRDFFNFPIALYKGNKYNAPALIADEKAEFDPEINGAFEYAEAKKFIAYDDGKCVGRIAAILSHAYNDKIDAKQLRFTRYDVIDDIKVTRALFDKIFEWARETDMNEIIGPIGFSDLDKQGLLIEGFEGMDLYVTPYNYPYYRTHLEQIGFTKAVDWVEYEIKVPDKMDPRLDSLCDKVMNRYGYKYLEEKNFKKLRPYMQTALREIMNEAFAPLYGVVKINDKQVDREIDMLKQIYHPDLLCGVMKDGEIVGYGFMAPNITKALQKFNGKFNLCGLITLMRTLAKFDKVDLYSIAVRKAHQNKGVNALIMRKGLEGLIKNNVKYVYTGPELETNNKVQSQWSAFERRIYRRRRCFTLKLD